MTLNPFAGAPRHGENEDQFGLRMLEHERRDAKTTTPRGALYHDRHTVRCTLREPLPCDTRVSEKKLSLMQKRIISYLTITGPSTVAGISEVTGINARTVAANMSALHNSSLIKKLYNVRVYGRTVATGRRDCWVYGPAPQQKEA